MFPKSFFLIGCVVAAALIATAYAAEEEEELYDSKYDNIDVNEIINNDRLRNQYFGCLIDKNPCLTDDAKFLKETFPEAVVTKCRRCTERQKYMFETVVNYYTTKEPDNWNLVLKAVINRIQKDGKHRR